MDVAVAAAERDGAQHAARVRRERLSVDHYLLLHYDVLREFAKGKNLPWTRPATKAEAATNWVHAIRAQGIRAYRETTTEATLETYLSKLLGDSQGSFDNERIKSYLYDIPKIKYTKL